ncbi:MAG: sirohydrochlorin chelatase [Bacillota bacterium]
MVKEGTLLLGHGSRIDEANAVIIEICRQVVEKKGGHGFFRVAFLQFGKPSLEEAVQSMVENGIERIMVVPVFLVPGNHIRTDIPEMLERCQAVYPEIKIIFADSIGADCRIAEILIDRMEAALQEVT